MEADAEIPVAGTIGTGVIFDDGPLRSARFPWTLRMKIMSQHASAAARYVPSLVSWVLQMMSTKRDQDGFSSYSKRIPRQGSGKRSDPEGSHD
jgi:hypothetical protein